MGFQSISETRRGVGQPDVLIYVAGIKIILEGSYTKKDAEDDIKKKVEGDLPDLGIALHYKEQISDVSDIEVKEKLKNSRFDVRMFLPKDVSEPLLRYVEGEKYTAVAESKWFETDVFGLGHLIKSSVEIIVKEEMIAKTLQEIEGASKDFVDRLRSFDAQKTISKNLYDVFYRLSGLSVGDYKEISELIYAQSFLALFLSVTFYESVQPHLTRKDQPGKPLNGISTLATNLGNKEGLKEAFTIIRKIDYQPVYDVALEVIEYLPETVFDNLITIGKKLASNRSLLRRDFSGRVYHKIVGDWSVRKGFATFYTTIPAAYLLAYMAVFSEFSPLNTDQIKVCDFACGSGSLLESSYSALEDRYELNAFKRGVIDLKEFHQRTLESNFWGFDALRYAVQIASLNLIFHNPSVPLNDMNFYTASLGIDSDNNVALGSLKFIRNGTLVDYFSVDQKAEKTTALDSSERKDNTGPETDKNLVSIPKFDLIIMNPPFTRATGRGGKKGGGLFGFLLDEKVRKKVMKEYEKIRNDVNGDLKNVGRKFLKSFKDGTFTGIGASGEGLLFLYLASQHLNEEGKLAFVLPKSMLNGASWFLIRAMLFSKFHVEYVVVSYDKDLGYNFSESTNLSELLIVAKKVVGRNRDPTKFVMLLNKPKTSFDARAMAKAIAARRIKEYHSPIAITDSSNQSLLGENLIESTNASCIVNEVSSKDLKDSVDNWGRFVAFPNLELLEHEREFTKGNIFGVKIPMAKLGEIASIGIDRHQFNDAFTIISEKREGYYPIVYGGDEDRRFRLQSECNSFAIPNNENARELFENKSGFLLVPDRVRLGTAHVISMFSPTKTLSNIFYAVKLLKDESPEKCKALCVWLNSTFGLISLIANREETMGAWISLKMSHWRLQPVLDINKLSKKKLKQLSDIFDKHKLDEIPRLPQQFDPEKNDSVRETIDREILKVLNVNFNDRDLKTIYRQAYESFDQWFEIGKLNETAPTDR